MNLAINAPAIFLLNTWDSNNAPNVVLSVMETDEFVRETLHNYVMQMVGEEYEDEQEPYTDNVVPLTFESKTRGNA